MKTIKRKNHVTAAVAVYLVLKRADKILFGRRQNTGYQDGNWQVFAGHVESGELPSEAAIREAKEELGIDILPENLNLLHVSARPEHDGTGNRVDFVYEIYRWSGGIVNMEPEKCSEMAWVDEDALPENTVPHVRYFLERMRERLWHSEIRLVWLQAQPLYKL